MCVHYMVEVLAFGLPTQATLSKRALPGLDDVTDARLVCAAVNVVPSDECKSKLALISEQFSSANVVSR